MNPILYSVILRTVNASSIHNVLAFNSTVMEWMVVARLWLDKQTTENLNFTENADYIHNNCDWSMAKHWDEWWSKAPNLKRLCKAIILMERDNYMVEVPS